ncbi:hypothetical protein SESBI_00221 [Sesbania bispinosa]|nr:hypothetical protein SESBI_00221 [Sesbania bispinosa]
MEQMEEIFDMTDCLDLEEQGEEALSQFDEAGGSGDAADEQNSLRTLCKEARNRTQLSIFSDAPGNRSKHNRCPPIIKLKRISWVLEEKEMENNALPVSSRDLENANSDFTFRALFLQIACWCLYGIPRKYDRALLFLCGSYLISYHGKNLTFDFEKKSSTNTVLSVVDAFVSFFPEIGHITKFMLSYFLTLMLVFPVEPGVQIFFLLLLISAPLSYFPELARNASASGVDVACGSFKLPLFWFATLGALGLSLFCGLLILLMVYCSWKAGWRFIKPKIKEDGVSLDALSEILDV